MPSSTTLQELHSKLRAVAQTLSTQHAGSATAQEQGRSVERGGGGGIAVFTPGTIDLTASAEIAMKLTGDEGGVAMALRPVRWCADIACCALPEPKPVAKACGRAGLSCWYSDIYLAAAAAAAAGMFTQSRTPTAVQCRTLYVAMSWLKPWRHICIAGYSGPSVQAVRSLYSCPVAMRHRQAGASS
jgi:hypothetical protein